MSGDDKDESVMTAGISSHAEAEVSAVASAPPFAPSAEKSSWPVRLYVGALLWAFLTLGVFTLMLDGRENNIARTGAQTALLACATLRLAYALHTKERGRGWLFYVILLFLAAPIWLLVEQPLWSLGRTLWGRGLNP